MRYSPVPLLVLSVVLLPACGSHFRVPPSETPPRPDLTLTFPDDPDLAHAPPPDMAEEPAADLAPPALLGCGSIITCINNCGPNAACQSRCPPIGTPTARALFSDLIVCILGDPQSGVPGACSAFNGGVCDANAPGFNARQCSDCENQCQSPDGACFDLLASCALHCVEDNECRADPQARCIDNTCALP